MFVCSLQLCLIEIFVDYLMNTVSFGLESNSLFLLFGLCFTWKSCKRAILCLFLIDLCVCVKILQFTLSEFLVTLF